MMNVEERDRILGVIREGETFYNELKSKMPKPIQRALNHIEEDYDETLKNLDYSDARKCSEWQKRVGMKGWEVFFCPETDNYKFVVENINSLDVVFDACAGDLRLDLLLSQLCKKVYAIEINPMIIGKSIALIGYDMPSNLIPICCNVLEMPLPLDTTIIVLLHRHFTQDMPREWWEKKVITNAMYSELSVYPKLELRTNTHDEK